MKKTEIISTDCPEPIGPYSEGLKSEDLIFTTQIGTVKDGDMISDDSQKQAEQSLKNIKSILEAGGGKMDDIVKCTVYLTNLDDFAAVNEVYKSFFTKPYPGRTCIQVAGLPGGARVEIEAIARVRA
jgi:2-iminobutanoate/2-iminopropanoate deaminase